VLLDAAVVVELGPLGRLAAGRVQRRDRRPRQGLAGGGGVQYGADVLTQPKHLRPRGRDGRRLIGRQRRRPRRGLGPALVVAGGREQVMGDALVDRDGVGQVEGGPVERDSPPGPLGHQPAARWVHVALAASSDSASSGLGDWYWGRDGDRICTQRIQA
jgi:hypothetical protein